MDVEYQKKEVTWCLDRVGPAICLKATAINDSLQHLEITSEEFILTFENEEAREFLAILQRITSHKPEPVKVSQPLPTTIQPPEKIEPIAPYIEKPKVDIETIPVVREQIQKPAPKLDTSEILEVLKQSESSLSEERISFRKKFAENKALEQKATVQMETPKIEEETISGIAIEEDVKSSEVFREKLDTASFFREVEEKSPLEQLLEETEEIAHDITTEEPSLVTSSESDQEFETIQEQEESVQFSPDDLNTSSFRSKFSSKTFEQELEEQPPQVVDEPQIVKPEDQEEVPVERSAFLSEEDRKKEVEKARAARKKRLWELTRGF
jgi:hypothetical protein